MIFFIEYDLTQGRIVELCAFAEAERARAHQKRLERELSISRDGIHREVVLLEAASEEVLRRTHRRYFENLEQLST